MLRLFVAFIVFGFCSLSGFDVVKADDYFDSDAAEEAYNEPLTTGEKAAAAAFNALDPRLQIPYRGGKIPDDGEDDVRTFKSIGAGLGSAAGKRDLKRRGLPPPPPPDTTQRRGIMPSATSSSVTQ